MDKFLPIILRHQRVLKVQAFNYRKFTPKTVYSNLQRRNSYLISSPDHQDGHDYNNKNNGSQGKLGIEKVLKYGTAFVGIAYCLSEKRNSSTNSLTNKELSDTHIFKLFKSPKTIDDAKKILEGETIDVNKAHPYGWTLLHVAAANFNPIATQMLLEAGADPNIQDEFNNVYSVSEARKVQPMEILLIREEDFSSGLNTRANFKGCTPMHYAALTDDVESIKVSKI